MRLALAMIFAAQASCLSAQTFSYGTHERQKLDAYSASTAGSPLVIYVHGGAWISGSKDDYSSLAANLNSAGMAVAVVNYRLSGEGTGIRHPQHARDVALAVNFAIDHAAEWNANPAKVFVMGHSAGAHIAGSLSTMPEFRTTAAKLAGFIGLEGIYDLPALSKRWPTYRDWFLSLAFGPEKSWRAASPQNHKPTTRAPWLLVHSPKDELVDTDQTKRFAKHLKSAKVPVKLDLESSLNHFGVVQALEKPDSPLFRTLKSFLLNSR